MFWSSSSPSPLGGKIVSVDPLRQAAAGLGALELDELSPLETDSCLGIATGFDCRVDACLCLNLGDPASLLEFKGLLRAATGSSTSSATLWTASDDTLLLDWVDSVTGSLGRHGLLFSGDVAKLGPNGHVTLTARGLRVLVAEADATEADFPIVVGLQAPRAGRQIQVVPTEPVGSSAAAAEPAAAPPVPTPHPEPGPTVAAHLQPGSSGIGRALGWSALGATVVIGAYYFSTPQGRRLFA